MRERIERGVEKYVTQGQAEIGTAATMGHLKPYAAYKGSGVEWLGDIPEHWEVKRIKYSAPLRADKLDAKPADQTYIGLENIEPGTGRILLQDQAENVDSSVVQFEAGDVLFGKLRPYLAKVARPELNGVSTGELLVLRPLASSQGYLFYSLLNESYIRWVDGLTYGTKMPRVNPDQVGNSMMPLPSEAEQYAIAAFLDRETAKIDALMAKKVRLIELLQEKRTALITRAVTKGLDPDVRMKDSGVGRLGAVPANWDLLALKRRWNVVDCKHLTVPFVGEGIPLASVRETQSFELDLKDAQRTTVEWYKTLIEGGRKPRRGDLIYCRNVSVGSASLVTGDDLFAMGQDVCLIRSSTENQRWLNYFLCSSAMSYQLASTLVGSTFNRINVAEVMTLLIPVPPRVEQDRIAQFLELETAKIDSLVAKVYKAINHLKELRTALISAAVTGKIDVRDGAAQTPGIAL